MKKHWALTFTGLLLTASAVMFTNCDPAAFEKAGIAGKPDGTSVDNLDNVQCTMEYRMSKLEIVFNDSALISNLNGITQQRILIERDGKISEYDSCSIKDTSENHLAYDFPLFQLEKVENKLVFKNNIDLIGISEKTHPRLTIQLYARNSCDDEEVEVFNLKDETLEWNRPYKVCHQYVNNALIEL